MSVTLHSSVAELLLQQVKIGYYQSPEDLLHKALERLMQQKINNGIREGITDIEAGRYVEIHLHNIGDVLSKPITQW